MSCHIFKLLLLVLVSACAVHGFNLSPLANQVYQIPENQKIFMEQTRSSYFGFAVTLRSDGIMVSAPRAQTTLEMQRKINETGVIYKCPFGAENSPCAPFVFDGLGDVESSAKNGMYRSTKKEYQLLGMSMDGKGAATDKFVVCAPKMMTPTSEHYLLHGICYVGMHGTVGDRLQDPPVEIAPLRRTNMQVHEFADHTRLVYMYGEMGINVHVTENNEEILIGAPGVYTWKGTVVRYRPIVEGDDGGLSKRDNTNNAARRGGRNIDRGPEIEYEADVPQPQLWNQTDDSYFGFAVTSGYFDGPTGRMLYAASAPNSGNAGEVYVFDIVNDAFSVGLKSIKKYAVLSGQQMGEYFGYAIMAEDFNNDGFTDLIIGAPSHSFDGYHEQVCVYYYQNLGNPGGFDFELKATLSGTGNQDLESRFGMSLGRIGDLDNDGYKDLAVGAPFDGQGSVYVFSGSAEGLRSTAVQKISNTLPEGAAIPEESAMFGMSISRGVDMDGNGYNDIAIGAPSAEKVLLYRSYPVVKVVASIVPDKRELAQTDNQVRVTVCVKLQPNLENSNTATKLHLKLHLDTQFGRAVFQTDKLNKREWDIQASEVQHCEEFELSIRPKLEFIFRPLELELHYENLNGPSASSPDFCENCVVVRTEPAFVSTKLFYMSGCATEKCVADLRVTSEAMTVVDPYIMGSTKTISYKYTIENHKELAYLPQMRITKNSQLQFAKIPPNCQTEEESLVCDITRPFLSRESPRSITITFDTSNMDGSELRISAQVFSSSEEWNPEDNMVTDVVTVAEFSEIESTGIATPSLVSLDVMGDAVNITHTITLRNQGPSIIKLMTIIVDIPMFHDAVYEIPRQLIKFNQIIAKAQYNNRDLAMSWVQNDTILIQNPTEQAVPVIADELDAIRYDNYKMGFPDFEPQDPQQQQMQSQQVFRRRRRRSAQLAEENAKTYNIYTQRVSDVEATKRTLKYSYDDMLSNRSVTFDGGDCDTSHQCVQLEVIVSNFRPSLSADVVIDVTVELDLSEVAKIFNERRDTLLYRLGLRLKKDNDSNAVPTISHHSKLPYTTVVTTIPKSTPLWIYIVSTICGLLFLTLLTYGLYRCGFFRREKRDEMARLTRQSKIEGDETDDD